MEAERNSEKVPNFLWWRLSEEFLAEHIKLKDGTRPYAGAYYPTPRVYKYTQEITLE